MGLSVELQLIKLIVTTVKYFLKKKKYFYHARKHCNDYPSSIFPSTLALTGLLMSISNRFYCACALAFTLSLSLYLHCFYGAPLSGTTHNKFHGKSPEQHQKLYKTVFFLKRLRSDVFHVRWQIASD